MAKLIYDLKFLKNYTLNEYIKAERSSRYIASTMKKNATAYCRNIVLKEMIENGLVFDWPVKLKFVWYLENKRVDPDNWSFLKKFIFDGMQKSMVRGVPFLDNDNYANIHLGYDEEFHVDKSNPRLEIYPMYEEIKK